MDEVPAAKRGLQAVLGKPIIFGYKSDAGGTVGAQDVMKAPADGYTP